jgi:hypothetical protein
LQDKKVLRKWRRVISRRLIKQVASAYGALINNANEAGKGRYSTIFDDGYFFKMLQALPYLWVAGAIGGPMV